MIKEDNNNIIITINEGEIAEYEKYYFSIHPKATKPPIKQPYQETVNVWSRMKRPLMNSLKQKWKDFLVWLITKDGYNNKGLDNCYITQRVFYKTARRHDIDNTAPKFILDGLVESGFLVDDDYKHLKRLTLECGVDKANPRTELIIEKIGDF